MASLDGCEDRQRRWGWSFECKNLLCRSEERKSVWKLKLRWFISRLFWSVTLDSDFYNLFALLLVFRVRVWVREIENWKWSFHKTKYNFTKSEVFISEKFSTMRSISSFLSRFSMSWTTTCMMVGFFLDGREEKQCHSMRKAKLCLFPHLD